MARPLKYSRQYTKTRLSLEDEKEFKAILEEGSITRSELARELIHVGLQCRRFNKALEGVRLPLLHTPPILPRLLPSHDSYIPQEPIE